MTEPDSLDERTSGTAMASAFFRALAACDPRPEIRGGDNLAMIFLDEEHLRPVRDPKIRQWVLKNKTAPGTYEFMVARTAFFDHIVQEALEDYIPQIFFLGAGYDSRPYRFSRFIRDTRTFELDTGPTQTRKRECLRAAGVAISNQISFVSVNFDADEIEAPLMQAGFDPARHALFLWEGVSYYLSAQAVDRMLAFIVTHSPTGSSIAFDYAVISKETLGEHSAQELRQHLHSRHPNERAGFGILAGWIREFLDSRGFEIVEHLSAQEMKDRYLASNRYPELAAPPSLLCLVHARRARA